jgi:hypothetical protein
MLVLGENVVDDASRLGCRNGLILRLPAWVISAFQSAPAASRARQL